MKRLYVALALSFAVALAAPAQITKPIRYTWIASSCETWNCAAAALVLADGDKHVIVLPTGQTDRPWVIVKRVEEGSIFIPDDEPFHCEVFDTVTDASSYFGAMDSCHGPLILNVPDGRAVITSLQKCPSTKKQRSVR